MSKRDDPLWEAAKKELLSSMGGSYDIRTICEVLREIFWETESQSIKDKVLEATWMAKKMDAKLRSNHQKWMRRGFYDEKTAGSKEKAKERKLKLEETPDSKESNKKR